MRASEAAVDSCRVSVAWWETVAVGVSGGIPKHAREHNRDRLLCLCASVVAARRPTLGERHSVRRKAGSWWMRERRGKERAASSSARTATAAVRVRARDSFALCGNLLFLADGSTVRPRSGRPRATRKRYTVPRRGRQTVGGQRTIGEFIRCDARPAAAQTRYAIYTQCFPTSFAFATKQF